MFDKSLGSNSHIYLRKKPPENVWTGRALWKLGRWLNKPSVCHCHDEPITFSSRPVETVTASQQATLYDMDLINLQVAQRKHKLIYMNQRQCGKMKRHWRHFYWLVSWAPLQQQSHCIVPNLWHCQNFIQGYLWSQEFEFALPQRPKISSHSLTMVLSFVFDGQKFCLPLRSPLCDTV